MGVGTMIGAGIFVQPGIAATRSAALARELYGSMPEGIGGRAPGTVAIVREREARPRGLADTVVQRPRT